MNRTQETLERIRAALEGVEYSLLDVRDGVPCVETARGNLHALLQRLRARAGFEMMTFVTAVDHLEARTDIPRFEVNHQLFSIAHNDRVRIKTRVALEDPRVPSCTDLWPGASYMERECWDLFGIVFDGHPYLKRLLMPEEYVHHPLRKEFPHKGIEPDRLYREWDRKRRAAPPSVDQGQGVGP